MRKVYEYFLKKETKPTIVIAVMSIIILLVTSGTYVRTTPGEDPIVYLSSNCTIWISILMGFVALTIPFIIFNFKMDKKSIDQIYSLPISKRELYWSKFLVGLTMLGILIFISWSTLLIYYLLRVPSLYILEFLLFLFVLIVTCSMIYAFVSYFVVICNTMLDAFIVTCMALIVLPCVVEVINHIIWEYSSDYSSYIDSSFFFIASPITTLAQICGAYMSHGFKVETNISESFLNKTFVSIIFNLVITSGAIFGYHYYIEHQDKGENAAQISNHIMGYPLLIGILSISSFYMCSDELFSASHLITSSIAILVFYILYAVYKRRVLLAKEDIIRLFIYLLIGIGINIVNFVISNLISMI